MKGLFSYRDYQQQFHIIFVTEVQSLILRFIPSDTYAWVVSSGFEHRIEEVPSSTMSIHLPHFQPFISAKEEIHTLLPDYAEGLFLSDSKEELEHAEIMMSFLRKFETYYPKMSAEERFRIFIPQYKQRLPFSCMQKIVTHLHHRHVTNENRFRLLLHCGIQPYVTELKQ